MDVQRDGHEGHDGIGGAGAGAVGGGVIVIVRIVVVHAVVDGKGGEEAQAQGEVKPKDEVKANMRAGVNAEAAAAGAQGDELGGLPEDDGGRGGDDEDEVDPDAVERDEEEVDGQGEDDNCGDDVGAAEHHLGDVPGAVEERRARRALADLLLRHHCLIVDGLRLGLGLVWVDVCLLVLGGRRWRGRCHGLLLVLLFHLVPAAAALGSVVG